MFKGISSINFKTEKSRADVFNIIEENLEPLGTIDISENGVIKINASKNNSWSYDCFLEGKIRERDGKYSIDIDIQVKPKTILWVLVICYGIGLLLLFFPYTAKGELVTKTDRILDNIRMEFK